jgi:hypothetical protein
MAIIKAKPMPVFLKSRKHKARYDEIKAAFSLV